MLILSLDDNQWYPRRPRVKGRSAMSDWQRARLIPTSGVSSEREAETRATSALLAVLSIVRGYSKALLDRLGASRAQNATVDAFVEVSFDWKGKLVRPDGVVRVVHGSRPLWAAIVEVKTGDNKLDADQVNLYWDIARANEYDAVITISNEIAPRLGEHPTPGLRVRKNSPVPVHHYSWAYLLAEALTQRRHRGIDDSEQRWILGELIRYLEHPASGATRFGDMGPSWVEVRDGTRHGSISRRDAGTVDVATRWLRLLRYAALRLGADIGEDVRPVWTLRRGLDAGKHTAELAAMLAGTGQLEGALRVPNTAGDIRIMADIRARQTLASLDIDAPADRGGRARVKWLLDQLSEAPLTTVVEAWPKQARAAGATVSLEMARADRTLLCPDSMEPARFRLVMRGEMGSARKAGGRSAGFVDSVMGLLDTFYVGIVQNLKPWRPPVPRKDVDARASDAWPAADSEVSVEILAELGAGSVPADEALDDGSPPAPTPDSADAQAVISAENRAD